MKHIQYLLIGLLPLLASASPYPQPATSATVAPVAGNSRGNFQPVKTQKGPQPDVTGEQVSNGALQVKTQNNQDGIGAGTDRYVLYRGDGTTGAGWPAKSQWVSFENMWNNSKPAILHGCEQYGYSDTTHQELGAMYNFIQQVALETYVDHRFILATIMQESSGCVRVPTSQAFFANPGLMQSANGAGTCVINKVGQVPCPDSKILQMIRDGTAGTNSGDGLANNINQARVSDVSAFYKAARLYNSGEIDSSGKLEAGPRNDGLHCYSSDIANRLTGWIFASTNCHLDD